MEKLLDFLVRNTDPGALRNLLRHLLAVRSASEFWDCVLLMLLIFIGCYLLLFRLRLFLSCQTSQRKKKQTKSKKVRRQETPAKDCKPNLLRWLYLLTDQSFLRYREKQPKCGKLLFVYNCITVSFYLLSALLVLLSLFGDLFRDLFLDLFFVHMYLNVLPKFLFDTLMWIHHRISAGDALEKPTDEK